MSSGHRESSNPGHRRAWRELGTAVGLAAGLMLVSCAGSLWAAALTVTVQDPAGQPVPGVVVVLRSEGHRTVPPPLPPQEVTQEKMRFVPAVSVVTPGTLVRFTNRDRWDHHVKGSEAQRFEFRIAGADHRPSRETPASAERLIEGGPGPVMLSCLIHGSMQGAVYVTDSPWWGVSDADGQVRWAQAPEGAVTLQVWHPQQLMEQPALRTVVQPQTTHLVAALNFTPRRRR